MDERFHLSTTQDKVKKFHKSPIRYVGTTRYGHIDLFGMFKQGSTLVLSRISCNTSSWASLEDEQKFKLGGCVGTHKA
jgi:hypothetical protein